MGVFMYKKNIDDVRKKFYKSLKNKKYRDISNIYESNKYDTQIAIDFAFFLINNKQYGKAIAVLKPLVGTNKNNVALVELAKIALKDKKYSKAKSYLKPIIDKSDYAKLEFAKIDAKIKNYDRAKKLFNELLNSNEFKNYAILELSKIEIELKNFDLAKKYLSNLFKTEFENAAVLLLGDIENINGNLEESAKIYRSIIKKDSRMLARYKLAKVDLELGHYIEAEKYLRELIYSSYRNEAIIDLIQLAIKDDDVDSLANYVILAIINKVPLDNKFAIYIYNSLGVIYKYIKSSDMTYHNYQLLDYDEYAAYEYINGKNSKEFNENIDIARLFNLLQDKLNYETIVEAYQFDDIYDVPYENIGSKGENTLRVYTIPNTKKILTMHPLRKK